MEVGAILEGNVVDLAPQATLDLMPATSEPQLLVPEVQPTLAGFEIQLPLQQSADQPNLHDRFGQLRIRKLREHFPRVTVVEAIAGRRRFMHWELCFADVLIQRGGFDLMLGNPPWLKVEWSEAGVLGEVYPALAIRRTSASDLRAQRSAVFRGSPETEVVWRRELEDAEGTQSFLGAKQNYPLLNGTASNLYKPFFPLSFHIGSSRGVVAFLAQESIYDEPAGGAIRSEVYRRLVYHFQFENQKDLFPIGNTRRFGISVLRGWSNDVAFDYIGNLFLPATIDECFQSAGDTTALGGIKDSNGDWNTRGHPDRVVRVDLETLRDFSRLFDGGIEPMCARLPVVHAKQLLQVLKHFSGCSRRLKDIGDACKEVTSFDENQSIREGLIRRRNSDERS